MAALDWLGKAQKRVNRDPAFKSLGTADIDLALKAGKTIRRVIFSAFEVVRIEDGDATTLVDVDVVEVVPRSDLLGLLGLGEYKVSIFSNDIAFPFLSQFNKIKF